MGHVAQQGQGVCGSTCVELDNGFFEGKTKRKGKKKRNQEIKGIESNEGIWQVGYEVFLIKLFI